MRVIKKILIFLLLLIFILISSLTITAYIIKDDVINAFKEKLGEHLLTKIEIGDISVRGLKKLPYISLQLNNVVVYSSEDFFKANPDHKFNKLLDVGEILISINIKDIIARDYSFTQMQIAYGSLNIETGLNNEIHNFKIWKNTAKKENKKEEGSFDLNNILFKNIDINIRLPENELQTNYFLKLAEASVSGKGDELALSIKTSGNLGMFRLEGKQILRNKSLNIDANVLTDNNKWLINRALIELNKTNFLLGGEFDNGPSQNLNFTLESNGADFKNVITLLPISLQKEIIKYRTQGTFKIFGKIAGSVARNGFPAIYGKVEVNDSKLILKNGVELNRITLSSEIENFKNSSIKNAIIRINNFSFYADTNKIGCTGKIINLKNPYLDLHVKGKMKTTVFNELFAAELLKFEEGEFLSDIHIGGVYDSAAVTFNEIIKNYNIRGYINLFNNLVYIDKYKIYVPLSQIYFNKSLGIQRTEIITGDTHMEVSIDIPDFYNNIVYKTPILIRGTINGGFIDVNKLYQIERTVNSAIQTTEKEKAAIPVSYEVNTIFNVDTVSFNEFKAYRAKGNFVMNDSYLSLTNLQFSTMDGTFFGGGQLSLNDKNLKHLKIQGNLNHINVSQLFHSFDDFGQDFLNHKHLSGDITGNVIFTSLLDSSYSIDIPSIWAESDVQITDGELIGWEPLKALSKYIDVEELEQVKFSTLENRITIDNSVVKIPYMDINSNAIKISGYGDHHFNNDFEYHIRLKLSDVLNRKSKRKRNDVEYAIEEDESGTNIYLKIIGNPDDFDVSYDLKNAFKGLKSNLKREKEEVKVIFNEDKVPTNNNTHNMEFKLEEEPNVRKKDEKSNSDENEKKSEIKFQWDDE